MQAHHDRNDDHAVERNVFGLPTAAMGVSNDAPSRLHPPSFKPWPFDDAGGQQTMLRHVAA